MSDNTEICKGGEKRPSTLERLREEITVLRIEGTLFCYDPKEAKRRRGIITNKLKDSDGVERPVSVHIHPDFGQPSILAYRVGQAIFLKMTEAGYPYPSTVAFTQRELARLVGKSWGGTQSRQLYHAMSQLQSTRITCSVHNKETKEYFEVTFTFLVTTLFSSKDKSITECVVQVHDAIVASLNRNHAIWLNYTRLSTLDTIGMVFYKRLFFHFSNIYNPSRARSTIVIDKAYEDICRDWLGGLKPEKYKSRIEKQLGKYLESVKATGLISRYEIATRANGNGFKLVFYPGAGFFEDYQDFYIRTAKEPNQPSERISSSKPQPLQLVAYFHQLIGHNHTNFTEKERVQAAELLKVYSDKEARAFIEYAVDEGKKSKYQMQWFGALLDYRGKWDAVRLRAFCELCNGSGMMTVSDEQGTRVRACTHGQTVAPTEGQH